MNDLISRQTAIEAIMADKIIITPELKPHYDRLGMTSRAADYNAACDKNIALLKLLPPAQQWIPVSEGLPNSYVDVLVSHSNKDTIYGQQVSLGYWCIDKWTITNGEGSFFIDSPIAWMPLPEPFKEVE